MAAMKGGLSSTLRWAYKSQTWNFTRDFARSLLLSKCRSSICCFCWVVPFVSCCWLRVLVGWCIVLFVNRFPAMISC